MSRRDRWGLFAWVFGALVLILGWFHIYTTTRAARHLDRVINRWSAEFHLNSEQASRVRAIERNFHGSGNPFLLRSHSPEEMRAHHQEVADTMNPDDRERFLKAEEGRKNHR
ncbi:MAG: hypothetical protein ABMA13_20010 [Chthoniobacteraceae bacterium]